MLLLILLLQPRQTPRKRLRVRGGSHPAFRSNYQNPIPPPGEAIATASSSNAIMPKKRYSPEVKERVVPMVFERQGEYAFQG